MLRSGWTQKLLLRLPTASRSFIFIPAVRLNKPESRSTMRSLPSMARVWPQLDPNLFQKTWLHRRPGNKVTLTIRRPGQAELLNITAVFRAVVRPSSIEGIAEQVVGSYPVVFLVVGLAVLFLRLEDRNAWLLALLCAGLISASPLPPSTVAMSPRLHAFMFAYRAIFLGVLAFTFYLFFAGFPQRAPLDRRLPWLKWLLGLLAAVIAVPGIPVGHPQPWSVISRIAGDKAAQYGTLAYIYGTLVLTLLSLGWSGLSTSDPEAKRKFRVITWGTLVGMGPVTLVKLISDFGGILVPFWLDFIAVIFLTLFPLSFAYAVVRYRVLEIPVLLKQSARYVLVRRGFAFLLLLLGCVSEYRPGHCPFPDFSDAPRARHVHRHQSGLLRWHGFPPPEFAERRRRSIAHFSAALTTLVSFCRSSHRAFVTSRPRNNCRT